MNLLRSEIRSDLDAATTQIYSCPETTVQQTRLQKMDVYALLSFNARTVDSFSSSFIWREAKIARQSRLFNTIYKRE
jgi:hypothetical protein